MGRRLRDNIRWNIWSWTITTVWRRSKLKNKVWHSSHYRHIVLLKRAHKQVEIHYSVIYQNNTHTLWKNSSPYVYGEFWSKWCKWPSRFCFLSLRKARWNPPLKYLEKLNQFHGLCKNRIPLVRFIIFQTLFSKGILTFVGPWRQCRVSLLTMVNGLPKNWIGTLPPLCSKTGDATNA